MVPVESILTAIRSRLWWCPQISRIIIVLVVVHSGHVGARTFFGPAAMETVVVVVVWIERGVATIAQSDRYY